MAKVMLRERNGRVSFYIAKKDLEADIVETEFDSEEKWGGKVVLTNGEAWYIEPKAKKIPCEVVAKKLDDEE